MTHSSALAAPDAALLSELPRALALHRDGRLQEARVLYEAVLGGWPEHFDALNLLGALLLHLKKPAAALDLLERAVGVRPASLSARDHLGCALMALGRCEEALACFDRCLAADPGRVESLSNRAMALQRLNRFDEALAGFDRAITLAPQRVAPWGNRATCLLEMGRLDEALLAYEQTLALAPGQAAALAGKSSALLLQGRLRPGWAALLEACLRHAQDHALPEPPMPLWTGRLPVEGRTLLLRQDYWGLGDVIQFSRYAAPLADRGARVLLQVAPALASLMRRLPGVERVLAEGEPPPAADAWCPVHLLPHAFGTGLDDIPDPGAYLRCDPARADRWATRLGPRRGLRVGWACRGNPMHTNDHRRSLPLACFAAALPPQVERICLQQAMRPEDRPALAADPGLRFLGAELADLDDTAALIAQVDVVVSVDTSVAHLAAALGKPTWIVLPHVPDFRWLLGREDSPWYGCVRLFRQDATRRWEPVLARVRAELAALAGG